MGTLRVSGAYDFSAGDIEGGHGVEMGRLLGASSSLPWGLWKNWSPADTRFSRWRRGWASGPPPSSCRWSSAWAISATTGEAVTGIVNAVIAGLVFAFSLRWTGTLWWAIGAHMSWDWGESFFYGVADSGIITPHHFLTGTPSGPAWLSGGTVGPEGSVFAAGALLLLGVVVRFTSPRYAEPGLERRRPPPPTVSVPGEIPPPASPPSASPSTYSVDSGDTN